MFVVILRLTHDLSGQEKLNFASLFLEIQDIPAVRLSCFLEQFIPTFGAENHSVKFPDLKISTETLLADYFETYSMANYLLDRKKMRSLGSNVVACLLRSSLMCGHLLSR